jgi:hypothetical protein
VVDPGDDGSDAALDPGVAEQMGLAVHTPRSSIAARGVFAWSALFGMISFELFGQLVGSIDPADAFFGYAVEQMADFMFTAGDAA